MAKRFGRNQRRKMRAEMAFRETQLRQLIRDMGLNNENLRRRLDRALELDVECIFRPMDLTYETIARLKHDARAPDLYVAERIEERHLKLENDTKEFIEWAARRIAAALAGAVSNHLQSPSRPGTFARAVADLASIGRADPTFRARSRFSPL